MKPLSETLTLLIGTAEDIIRRPAQFSGVAPSFAGIAADLRHADASPSESVRTTRAGVIMCTAIEAFFADPKTDHHWQMVIGTILPLLRIDAYQQLLQERDSLKSEADR